MNKSNFDIAKKVKHKSNVHKQWNKSLLLAGCFYSIFQSANAQTIPACSKCLNFQVSLKCDLIMYLLIEELPFMEQLSHKESSDLFI